MKGFTLEQYNKKYRNRKEKILKVNKKEVEDFNKKNPSMPKDYLLSKKKWTLIGDTYYQIPRCPSFSWFRNLHIAFQVGAYALLTGAAFTGVVLANMESVKPKIVYITYNLDTDLKLEKNPNYDIVIDEDSELAKKLPGKTLKHSNSNADGFKVLAFTDSHLDHNKVTCSYTFSMLARNIMRFKPDLIVFCGDNITSSYNEPRTHQFAQMLEDLGVYWCATLGNHEKNRTNPHCIERQHMIDIWCQYPHCLIDNKTKTTSKGDVWGVGNTLINLVNNNEVTQSLYFLDSGTEMNASDMEKYADQIQLYKDMGKAKQTEVDFYDYIKDSQVEWYKETFNVIRDTQSEEEKKPHSTIFSHVPLIEQGAGYLYLFNEWEKEVGLELQKYGSRSKIRGFTDYPQDRAKDTKDLYNSKNGYLKGELNRRREDLCYSPHDLKYINQEDPLNPDPKTYTTPIFAAMKSFGDNNAFFCGHDHQNNYSIKWDGQFLGYVQPACYSSNNLYTEGLLGADPFKPDAGGKYDGHLIQGFTELYYSSTTSSSVNNVISEIKNHDNYTYWNDKPELYNRILLLIKIQLYTGKGRIYADKHTSFLDGNE